MSGYLDAQFAKGFREAGEPLQLPRSGAWILVREVPGTDAVDACGLYPILCCADWKGLGADLQELEGVASFTAVPDPFGDHTPELLETCFPDLLRPYKEHYVADLELSYEQAVSKHHRYYGRRALRALEVEHVSRPLDELAAWCELYDNLVQRHGVTGLAAFSAASFAEQLQVDGLVMTVARADGVVVGAQLWFLQGEVAYSHLAAASEEGYALQAQYALYADAFERFRGAVRWLALGGAPDGVAGGGLAAFKRGWASSQLPSLLAGRICDQASYRALVSAAGASEYFPAYRR